MNLKQRIRGWASELGFDLCCFTKPALDPQQVKAYRHWVELGYFASMDWMAEPGRMDRRVHPERMLPGVKSIICLGMRHPPPPCNPVESPKGRGVIAAYALGDDYHKVMKSRLKRLAATIDVHFGKHDQRIYVDTAPVMETALAQSSGLGWQGKHSLIINRRFGSWLLLGEIFTTLEIDPDKPADNHCGRCTACMDACPTGAIVAPYMVDARRCIAYLTIEHKGYIPHAFRSKIGMRIFGCDDCQWVCPWNRKIKPVPHDPLHARIENILPPLIELVFLDEEGFRKRFPKSPIRRVGRVGFVRNVVLAMGNSGRKEYLFALREAKQDASPIVRAHAAWAIARLEEDRERAVAFLKRMITRETNPQAVRDLNVTLQGVIHEKTS